MRHMRGKQVGNHFLPRSFVPKTPQNISSLKSSDFNSIQYREGENFLRIIYTNLIPVQSHHECTQLYMCELVSALTEEHVLDFTACVSESQCPYSSGMRSACSGKDPRDRISAPRKIYTGRCKYPGVGWVGHQLTGQWPLNSTSRFAPKHFGRDLISPAQLQRSPHEKAQKIRKQSHAHDFPKNQKLKTKSGKNTCVASTSQLTETDN